MANHDPPEVSAVPGPASYQPNEANDNQPIDNKRDYYYPKYYNYKEKIYNNIKRKEEKEQNTAWKYINSVKLINYSMVQLNGKIIFESIKDQLSVDTTKIKSITLSKSKKVWTIELNETEFEKAKDKTIHINNTEFRFIDANQKPERKQNQTVTLKAVLRIHWLPSNFEKEEVSEYLKDRFRFTNIIVKEVEKEHFKDEMSHIENGIIKVKIEYPFEDYNYVANAIGRIEINKVAALLQVSGHPPKCRHCDSFRHSAKSCPKKDLICSKCNGKFHTEYECNYAFRLVNNVTDDAAIEDYDDEDDEEEMDDENCETPQQNSTTDTNHPGKENQTVTMNQLNDNKQKTSAQNTQSNQEDNISETVITPKINLTELSNPVFLRPASFTVAPVNTGNKHITIVSNNNQAAKLNSVKTVSSTVNTKRHSDRTSLDGTQNCGSTHRARTESTSTSDDLDKSDNEHTNALLSTKNDTVTPKPNNTNSSNTRNNNKNTNKNTNKNNNNSNQTKSK